MNIILSCIGMLLLLNNTGSIHSAQLVPPPTNSGQKFTPQDAVATPVELNATNKNDLSPVADALCQSSACSFSRDAMRLNHPRGSSLFPNNGALAGAVDRFLNTITAQNNQFFLIYFSKLQLLILHQVYMYLAKIYTTLILTNVETIEQYTVIEQNQAITKKKLVISHLINLIEAQINSSILARFPALPKEIATRSGTLLMKNDYGTALEILLEQAEDLLFQELIDQDPVGGQQVKTIARTQRVAYIGHFADYLKLFSLYTQPLMQTQSRNGVTNFLQYSTTIASQSQGSYQAVGSAADPKTYISQNVQKVRSIPKTNPPLFWFDAISSRSISLIAQVAQSIPSTTTSVTLPQKIIDQATSGARLRNKFGNVVNNQPIAFFQGTKLFVNIPTLKHMYSQELLPQPEWLNSPEGIMTITRACLGDFAALLEPLVADQVILDPCLKCIVADAATAAGLQAQTSSTDCAQCKDYLVRKHNAALQERQTAGGVLPGLPEPNIVTQSNGFALPPPPS